MSNNTTIQQSAHVSITQKCINVYDGSQGGVMRVSVPAHIVVDHAAFFSPEHHRYFVLVWSGNEMLGLHCGERTGQVISFTRESDALRLCRVRNKAEKQRVALLHAQRSTPKAGEEVA